jgi:type IV pilus assembly protein PilN
MLRINLLPVREKRRRSAGQRHIFLIAALVGVECLGFYYVYSEQDEERQKRVDENAVKQKKIDKLKAEIGDISELESKKSELQQQQKILDALEVGRQGPVRVLQDIWFMLTPPTDRRTRVEIERRGGQPNWDPKRLWLTSFVESERDLTILGAAKSNDDVAEFLTRLGSSKYFNDVQLLWTKGREADESLNKVKYVQFNVRCRVSYLGGEANPLGDMLRGGGTN